VVDPTTGHVSSEGQLENDELTLAALKRGDEAAFVLLFKRYHRPLVRLAASYVKRDDIAEEVAQEAWQGLFESLARFTLEASIKTWLYRILINCARARQRKERRIVPLSSLEAQGDEGPSVPRERFQAEGHQWAGHWSSVPRSFVLDDPAVSAEARVLLSGAIAALPENQREVMTLRDVEGFSAEQVCNILALSDMNQRVLLHRARAKVRAALEERLGGAS
jgi:RNA polymerase sigma-70 factor (ECF subfamily)